MDCPRCRVPLSPHSAPRLVLFGCLRCGGLWLDGDTSRRVVEALDPNAMSAAHEASSRASVRVDDTQTIACPSCARTLERMRIEAANVQVDCCRDHGVWFDRDELPRVVDAVVPKQRNTPVPMANAPVSPTSPAAPQQTAPVGPTQYQAPGMLEQPWTPNLPGLASAQGFNPAQPAPTQQAPQPPGQPAQPQGSSWGAGKTALAVGAGAVAVAGVAYVATHASSNTFGEIGDVLSKLL